ncbi:hypothetical protein HYV50_03955 [Candidatus Pacearchaeota archaeon]|nr:hypothetical protein [Candidatus Pacearchaeota archaeon]
MNKKQIWKIILVPLVVALVVSVITVFILLKSGLAFSPSILSTIYLKSVRANSCDADSTCEVQGTISSINPLKFSSNSGLAKLEADLTLTKLGQTGGAQFITNNAGSLTIIPQSGSAKLEADLTLTKAGQSSGVLFKTDDLGGLTITPVGTPASGNLSEYRTILDSILMLRTVGQTGNVLLKNEAGNLRILPKGGSSRVEGTVYLTSLAGNMSSGYAYVCVDPSGKLFRSSTACR